MNSTLSYFKWPILASILTLVGVYLFTGSMTYLISAVVLAIVEVTFSFDNAVVNAKILQDMNEFWKKIFLTIGILIAVFGMRFYLPIQIVSSLGGLSLIDAYHLAIKSPEKFSEILRTSHDVVAGAGGAFLFMVGLKYFIDEEKEHHWLPGIENFASKIGGFSEIQIFLISILGIIVSYVGNLGTEFILSVFGGIILYVAVDIVKNILETLESKLSSVAVGGLGAFLYLEVLDASFSFDGVIAAFAISDNIFVIAAGLGIGAFFIRSMTMYLVDKGTMQEYQYLEHGAMWAIIVLACFMFAGTLVHIPEAIIALVSVSILGAAFYNSYLENKKNG